MGKHSLKDWFTVTRYWSFPVSTMPVLASFAYLFSKGLIPSGPKPYFVFILCLLGVVVLHSAGNVLSDWFDYRSGVDNENAFAVPNLVFHHFEPSEYLRFSFILLDIGILIGICIAVLSGPVLFVIGGVGVLLTLLYSFLKYHALGDLDVFIIFGILPVLGTVYAVTGEMHWDALVLSLPIGLITVSVLHANNTFDIESDGAAGIKTFAMLIGGKASSVLYAAYMVIPFLCVIVAVGVGRLHPMSLICLVAGIQAWQNFKQACGYDRLGLEAMKGLDQASAKLQMTFSVLLSAGLFISVML
ncbi:MAG: prenyltransferase [Bacteroidales bacterium]|nr:prenyltransferase [Bacteroidales bacterium]